MRLAFVINPNSGSDRKTDRVALVKALAPAHHDYDILHWEKVEDADRIFSEVRAGGYDIAVAVGGDGTVSQLAEALCGTGIALGILPFGSGNGLARHLGVSMKKEKAMALIDSGKIVQMDRGYLNDRSFFCTAGMGFDALIGKRFADSPTRGFRAYFNITVSELRRYKPERYKIRFDGQELEREAFLITCANAGQYGNNAWIAPGAKINDGILQLAILKPFRWWNAAGLARRLFNKSIHESSFVETYAARRFEITRQHDGPIHYDGEPGMMQQTLEVRIEESALRVLVPNDFTG